LDSRPAIGWRCIGYRLQSLQMTRYTNIGRQRTYIQATFDPKNDHQASTTISASTPVLDTLDIEHEGSVDTPVESNRRKRRRKSDGNSDVAGPTLPIVASDSEKKKSVVKSEKTKKALAKLKAKEKAKRAKCASTFLKKKQRKEPLENSEPYFSCHRCSCCGQSCFIRGTAIETHS
jgi:hypothetical protein